jgi:hypothetical protein
MIKVFLGGTVYSNWREEFIPQLTVNYFNPIVKDWTPECQVEEIKQREECDFVLFTITKEMTGVYAIAEVVDDSNKRPEKTLFCVLEEGFAPDQIKSLKATSNLIEKNGGKVFTNLYDVAKYLHQENAKREEDTRQRHLRLS